MKEIFHEYGKALLTAGGVMLLMFLVFHRISLQGNTGLFDVLKEDAKIKEKNYEQYEDSKGSRQIAATALPEIMYVGDSVRAGKPTNLKKLFKAMDWEGHEINIEVRELKNKDKQSLAITGDLEKFVFPRPGIYQVLLKVRDKEGGIMRNIFSIPVNYGGGHSG